jgi:subtilisin family serine protease
MDDENLMDYEGEDYADLIEMYQNYPPRLNKYAGLPIHYMNEIFAIVHVPVSQLSLNTLNPYSYSEIPKLYGLTSEISLEASGIKKLRAFPALNLRGNGVLVGIIDTGIDYTNPVFFKSDGTTKIISIWDQTINTGSAPYDYTFGTEYQSNQINDALASSNSYNIVPSRDEIGHGTMMAAIAAGNENPDEKFSGVVPDAELIIVKLKQAKQYLRNFYVIPENANCYQENHIMWGVQYCIKKASELNKPIVICTGVGSSQGSHAGQTHLSTFLSIVGDFPKTAVVVPVGNEGNRRRHYYGTLSSSTDYNTVELQVGENEGGFSMELWGKAPGLYTIDITSPSGEYIPQFTARLQESKKIRFIFDKTILYIDFQITESLTGEELILMRFRNISAGIWKINVYGLNNLSTGFHIWLPMGDMISNNTYFIRPDIYTTVLDPGASTSPLSITTYNIGNDSLYLEASRGYTSKNIIKPELAAPGVDYIAPNQNKKYVSNTGSSVAAAHTAGIAAMILEWGVVRGNRPDLDTLEVKNYLIRGAIRRPNLSYPNNDWGYGIIDVFNSYNALVSDTGF